MKLPGKNMHSETGYPPIPESPAVTVLMTVYNGLPYVREAIDSILGQTFGDFEFLIIDDASTDASVDCVRFYRDPRIRLECNNCNMRQVGSLNRGLGLARGRYVARMDQDDVSLPTRLEKQVAFLEQRPDIDVIGTWADKIDAHGHIIGRHRASVTDYGEFVGQLSLGQCGILHPSTLFRRHVVVDAGSYDASFAPAEDYELWVRLALRRHAAYNIPEVLFLNRTHREQQTVTDGVIQWRNARRAHNRLVATFCHPDHVYCISLLALFDEHLWTQCILRGQLGSTLRAADAMLRNMQCELNLSAAEFASLKRVWRKRLGLGVIIGAKIANCPSVIFYPVFFLLSPLLVPRVRYTLLRLAHKLKRFLSRCREGLL
jgi:glycosyltransferase involved in cell wall biosynthesis